MKAKRTLRSLLLGPLLISLPVLELPASSQVKNVLPRGLGISSVSSSQSHSTTGPGTQQSGSNDIVRLETNLVTVPAVVMDRDGRYITDLRKEDFRILEDGVEQDVAFFAPVEQPFTILFLLDTSSSMSPHLGEVAHSANSFFRHLRPHDQLIVASFNEQLRVLREATRIDELPDDIKFPLRIGGKATMIYDAVKDALKHMKRFRGRKAIVLFSDGIGAGIFANDKSNLHDAEEQDVLIYTVQFGSFPAEPPHNVSRKAYFQRIEEGNNYMRDLAQMTGGRYYQVESVSDLSETFGLVANELRRQYSLGYYPKTHLEVGQRRKIKVRVRLPDLVVRARDSYIVKPSQKSQN